MSVITQCPSCKWNLILTIWEAHSEISPPASPRPSFFWFSLNHLLFFFTNLHTTYFILYPKHMLTRNHHTYNLCVLICVFVSVMKYLLSPIFCTQVNTLLCYHKALSCIQTCNSCSQVLAFPLLHPCAFLSSYYSTSPACIACNLAQETGEVGSDLEKWGQ